MKAGSSYNQPLPNNHNQFPTHNSKRIITLMNVHIALYKWKASASPEAIRTALKEVEAMADKVPGVIEISTGVNSSKYGEGYTHVILVRAESTEAIDNYRKHPDHQKVVGKIEAMEDHGIGVDFSAN